MSKSESRKASKAISFRMTPDEHETLMATAAIHGLGLSTFSRRAVFNAISLPAPDYEARVPDKRKADLSKMIGQLGRIASSANQLAKIANSTGTPTQAMVILELQKELSAIRTQLVKAG